MKYNLVISFREMLMDAFRALVNNPFKKKIMRKKTINVLTGFFIFHKSCVKIFLK